MTSYLIGLSGRAGSGKDTVARMMGEAPKDFPLTRMAFAAPIKRICGEVFDFTDDQTNGALKETPDPRYQRADGTCLTPREAMQTLGTEWGRQCYPQVWVELGLRLAKEALDQGTSVVFTDVRFVNEAAAIRAAGGFVLQVVRPGGGGSTHPSEIQMFSEEFRRHIILYIDNRGTIEELRETVGTVVGLLPSLRAGVIDQALYRVGPRGTP